MGCRGQTQNQLFPTLPRIHADICLPARPEPCRFIWWSPIFWTSFHRSVSVKHNFPTVVSPFVVNTGLGLLQLLFQDVSVNISSQWAAQTLKLPPPLYKSEEMRTQSKQYIVYLSNLHNPPTVFQTNSTAVYRLCLLSVRFGDRPF